MNAILMNGEARSFGFGHALVGYIFESLEIFADEIKQSIERNGLNPTFDYMRMSVACRMLPGRKITVNLATNLPWPYV